MAGMAELQQIIRLVEQSLDEPDLDAGELAGLACLSRFHFDRLVSAALGEPPGAFRRRLLLERGAHRLVSTRVAVIRIGGEAGYISPDAFTRAFFRAYGTTPDGLPAAAQIGARPSVRQWHPLSPSGRPAAARYSQERRHGRPDQNV